MITTLFDNQPIAELTYEARIAAGEVVRALWWKQPYAQLMLHGKVETRSRDTKTRGLVLICSTLRPFTYDEVIKTSGLQSVRIAGSFIGNNKVNATLLNGYAIAMGELNATSRMYPVDEDKSFVEFKLGLWCWHFKNVRPIEPFPLPGKQGWSIIDNETRNKIKFI